MPVPAYILGCERRFAFCYFTFVYRIFRGKLVDTVDVNDREAVARV